jgi:hypothetical protein
MDMDNALGSFQSVVAGNINYDLDYSPESLLLLEDWLLNKYENVDTALMGSEAKVVDGAARYVGEIFRKSFGGRWVIELIDKKNAFYGLPQLSGMVGQKAQICPSTLVTSSIDRRSGSFLKTIYLNSKSCADFAMQNKD